MTNPDELKAWIDEAVREIGDRINHLDQTAAGGFMVHVRVDDAGKPQYAMLICIEQGATEVLGALMEAGFLPDSTHPIPADRKM